MTTFYSLFLWHTILPRASPSELICSLVQLPFTIICQIFKWMSIGFYTCTQLRLIISVRRTLRSSESSAYRCKSKGSSAVVEPFINSISDPGDPGLLGLRPAQICIWLSALITKCRMQSPSRIVLDGIRKCGFKSSLHYMKYALILAGSCHMFYK